MRGMRGIAEQDDVPVAPLAADDAREVDPRRAANMAGIGHQLMAAQMIGEDLFAQAAAFFLAHLAEAEGLEDLGRRLDDEGRGVLVELVSMRPDPAMLGIHENEVERVEALVGAQPDELVALHVYIGLEAVVVAAAQFRIEPVGGNDEVIACERSEEHTSELQSLMRISYAVFC